MGKNMTIIILISKLTSWLKNLLTDGLFGGTPQLETSTRPSSPQPAFGFVGVFGLFHELFCDNCCSPPQEPMALLLSSFHPPPPPVELKPPSCGP